ILLHIVSMDSENPIDDYQKINNELILYDESLKDRTQIVVANKMDVDGAKDKFSEFQKSLKGIKVIPISAINKEGLQTLKYEIASILKTIPKFEPKDTTKYYTLNAEDIIDFVIHKGDDGVYELTGDKLFILFNRTDFNNES